YRAPKSRIGRFFWRWRLWFEATFAISMLQPWEKGLIVVFMLIFWGLLLTGIYRYLPYHLEFLYRRGVYYLSGTE
ncbi:hypothetical protein BC834DRAFT_795277, partial [Gloeopeniophorella convolvens]